MDFPSFDRQALYRQLHELEKHISFDAGTNPLYDSFGRPLDAARRALRSSAIEIYGRVKRVSEALSASQPIAFDLIAQDLNGLKIEMIWPILKSILYDIVLYVGGATLAGGAIGAGIGFFGAGAGAIPGAAVGASLGARVGGLILQIIGIGLVAEYMIKALPQALEYYVTGLQQAWGPPPQRRASNSGEPLSANYQPRVAATTIARGHVLLTYAFLMGLVAYLLRPKGGLKNLQAEITKSKRLGPKVAQWLKENEKSLLENPKLKEPTLSKPTVSEAGGSTSKGAASSSATPKSSPKSSATPAAAAAKPAAKPTAKPAAKPTTPTPKKEPPVKPAVPKSSFEDFCSTVDDFKDQGPKAKEAFDLYKKEDWPALEKMFNENNLNGGWPPNRGAIAIEEVTLKEGAKIDRYGGYIDKATGAFKDGGTFTAKAGEAFENRALPLDTLNKPYRTYEVLKDLPQVQAGEAIPWFGQPGKGIQYELPTSIDNLISKGYLKEIGP